MFLGCFEMSLFHTWHRSSWVRLSVVIIECIKFTSRKWVCSIGSRLHVLWSCGWTIWFEFNRTIDLLLKTRKRSVSLSVGGGLERRKSIESSTVLLWVCCQEEAWWWWPSLLVVVFVSVARRMRMRWEWGQVSLYLWVIEVVNRFELCAAFAPYRSHTRTHWPVFTRLSRVQHVRRPTSIVRYCNNLASQSSSSSL